VEKVRTGRWQVTGRFVLLSLVGFFAVVFAVNAVMVRAAMSTFSGVEVASSYKAGLKFGADRREADQQDGLGWHVDGRIARERSGQPVFEFDVRDRAGALVPGLTVEASLAHPADNRRDQAIAMREIRPGVFSGVFAPLSGQWELKLDLLRGAERVFRSQSRINLR